MIRFPRLITTLMLTAAFNLPVYAESPVVTVYKSPTCGCCKKWIAHLEKNGFKVNAHDTYTLDQIKQEKGIPPALSACHTASVNGYIVEGHVPADAIKKLLRERPKAKGITVPGMPLGSPGMEVGRAEPYDVLLFDDAGKTRVYQSIRP